MRPRRKVIIYSYDILWASQIRFILETRIHVSCTITEDLAVIMQLDSNNQCDAVVVLSRGTPPYDMLQGFPKDIPSVLVKHYKAKSDLDFPMPVIYWRGEPGDSLTLLTSVKLLTTHKRGPKKQEIEQIVTVSE